ncbi:MAG TPA: glycosyltransferase family 87 protein [Nitrososphaerales archaeon]|nr:glycosyltransferase family 87 protein [Nitrososphaerales archaeon]HUK74266.1 glycosyltransferase family 87 protein [Nitrososphaerales archaeon]
MEFRFGRREFALFAAALIALNVWTFAAAYPETMRIDAGCCTANSQLAKDFSAFYTAAWRLFHDPSQVYAHGYVNDGEFRVLPQPEGYKYMPSFLWMVSPILALPYQSALTAFDLLQLALLPLMAFLVYELVKEKGALAAAVVALIVLLLPLPLSSPGWSITVSYYWQWAEGQSKVLLTFMFLLALYLGKRGMPRLSGVVYGLAAFDPRFAVLALPLFFVYNRDLRKAVVFAVGAFVIANVPLFYPPLAGGLFHMAQASSLTPPYYYTLIPTLGLASLIVVNYREIIALASRWLHPERTSVTSSGPRP